MVRSPGFGSNPVHLIALFRLAFTVAPPTGLTLRTKLTRWIVLQKARRHRTSRLRLLVGTKFQDLFHSPPGVLFTFPSLYLFTIDRILYLALAGGPARFKQGFSCPVLLDKTHIRSASFLRTRLSRSLASHSNYSANHAVFSPYLPSIASSRKPDTSNEFKFSGLVVCNITTPCKHSPISLFACEQAKTYKVWALPVSLATTPRIVIYFLFLILLRCFSSDGSRSLRLCIQRRTTWLSSC